MIWGFSSFSFLQPSVIVFLHAHILCQPSFRPLFVIEMLCHAVAFLKKSFSLAASSSCLHCFSLKWCSLMVSAGRLSFLIFRGRHAYFAMVMKVWTCEHQAAYWRNIGILCSHCWSVSVDQAHKSHNAPVPYPTMCHSEQKCAHFCSEWCIVGYGTGALWDLWIWSAEWLHHVWLVTRAWVRTLEVALPGNVPLYYIEKHVKQTFLVDTYQHKFNHGFRKNQANSQIINGHV